MISVYPKFVALGIAALLLNGTRVATAVPESITARTANQPSSAGEFRLQMRDGSRTLTWHYRYSNTVMRIDRPGHHIPAPPVNILNLKTGRITVLHPHNGTREEGNLPDNRIAASGAPAPSFPIPRLPAAMTAPPDIQPFPGPGTAPNMPNIPGQPTPGATPGFNGFTPPALPAGAQPAAPAIGPTNLPIKIPSIPRPQLPSMPASPQPALQGTPPALPPNLNLPANIGPQNIPQPPQSAPGGMPPPPMPTIPAIPAAPGIAGNNHMQLTPQEQTNTICGVTCRLYTAEVPKLRAKLKVWAIRDSRLPPFYLPAYRLDLPPRALHDWRHSLASLLRQKKLTPMLVQLCTKDGAVPVEWRVILHKPEQPTNFPKDIFEVPANTRLLPARRMKGAMP